MAPDESPARITLTNNINRYMPTFLRRHVLLLAQFLADYIDDVIAGHTHTP